MGNNLTPVNWLEKCQILHLMRTNYLENPTMFTELSSFFEVSLLMYDLLKGRNVFDL